MLDGSPDATVWAGTIWRDDRYPTEGEIEAALTRWRGLDDPAFHVTWDRP